MPAHMILITLLILILWVVLSCKSSDISVFRYLAISTHILLKARTQSFVLGINRQKIAVTNNNQNGYV